MPERITSWSFTRVETFEKCKFRAKLLYIDKEKEPVRPLKPGQTEHGNDRGTRLHNAAEAYIKGEPVDLAVELSKFSAEYVRLRELYAQGKVSVEGEWGFNELWQPCDWFAPDVWGRVKIDALVFVEEDHALVTDLKTGKKSGNEIKHHDQGVTYAVAVFARYPHIDKVTVEFWYPDVDELTRQVYTRKDHYDKHLKKVNARVEKMLDCTSFPANPNKFTCMFCQFGAKGNGLCPSGM